MGRHGHVMFVALIIGVVALMVLPVPAPVLDLIIACNIAASVLLLMLAIYIPGALGMSTFPSMIVLTTVLRLSLNIASTKQILLHAHAGNIIETFGRLVMGGQVVVGVVVFAIIAVVQFIVISKGAERVAEVGARFTLDAMPGKQMSIEADLRGGLIDRHEARRQRSLLEQESHMHGSMDGAMKFVKGDAIAAIIIALVNIVAGIYVGAALHGMSIGDAVARYTLLSVGDGMVSQIPSLLTCVAAAVLTTRIAGQEGRPRNLAAQVGMQIIAQPTALIAAGGVLLGFAAVPGFPKLPFIMLGAAMLAIGVRAHRRQRKAPSFAQEGEFSARGMRGVAPPQASVQMALPQAATDDIVAPLVLRLSVDMRERLSAAALQHALETERTLLQHDLGIAFPELQIRFEVDMPPASFAVEVQEISSANAMLPAVQNDGASLTAPEEWLAKAVAEVVRMRPDAFVGMQEINAVLKRLQTRLPELSEEVLRGMPLQRLAEVIRRLALEGVSLRYMREIFESLLVWAPREKDSAALCEHVRADLGRFICHRLVDAEQRLHVISVDGATEAVLRESIKQGPGGAYVAVAPDTVHELVQRVETAMACLPAGRPAVLIATPDTRRFLRRLLVARLSHVHVLSYAEVPANTLIHPAGRLASPKAAALRAVAAPSS